MVHPSEFEKVFGFEMCQIWQKTVLTDSEVKKARTALESYADLTAEKITTIGNVLYRRVKSVDSLAVYFDGLEENNSKMGADFGWLYGKVINEFQIFFGEKVQLTKVLGYPGFLVMRGPPEYNTRPHFDLQHRLLPKSIKENYLLNKTFTFTLALELPTSGSGLMVWPLTYKRMLEIYKSFNETEIVRDVHKDDKVFNLGLDLYKVEDAKLYKSLQSVQQKFVSYKVGCINLLVGNLMHQTFQPLPIGESEFRTVMVGHGLWHKDGYWELYW